MHICLINTYLHRLSQDIATVARERWHYICRLSSIYFLNFKYDFSNLINKALCTTYMYTAYSQGIYIVLNYISDLHHNFLAFSEKSQKLLKDFWHDGQKGIQNQFKYKFGSMNLRFRTMTS